jgi:predicted CDP-diglyceride synthetase/phosphatidate cytidylyltransferase
MNPVFWSLILGLGTLLTVASLVGFLLQQHAHGLNPTINNLNTRIKSWWVLVAILSVAIGLGPRVSVMLFGFASFMALREFLSLTPTKTSPLGACARVLRHHPAAVRVPRDEVVRDVFHFHSSLCVLRPVGSLCALPGHG